MFNKKMLNMKSLLEHIFNKAFKWGLLMKMIVYYPLMNSPQYEINDEKLYLSTKSKYD